MEPALEVIHGALNGDQGARAFLERTSSIYALDVTNPSSPKTYGCWNFIHQAMNEIERYEATYITENRELPPQTGAGLVSHARLLASVSLRVARRSPALDKKLVATCLANSEQFHGTPDQAQWLMDLNLELREIVMGRIAAMAFDFSFHRRVGPNGHSAFADNVVMDTLCSILSANAVASGPLAIRHFATEWIIPSSKSLPVHAVASVILHLALEGMRKSAPAGTKDMLQQLSLTVLSVVLVPMLADASTDNSVDHNEAMSQHGAASQISSTCLQALRAWCNATELSLPQLKHICSKAEINIANVLTDVMYSDSVNVIDALADTVELLVCDPVKNPFTEGRINQVQYIIGVDKQSFQAEISPDQLTSIEVKEMAVIVLELVSAVGLQRFRFTERENMGDNHICRNLIRIASAVSLTWIATSTNDPPDRGLVTLLQKGAGHPSLHVCSLALDALTAIARSGRLTTQFLLATLQRRAIIPHRFENGVLALKSIELCAVTFDEFLRFRENTLSEALITCFAADSHKYIDSCTSAVEEFCMEDQPVEISLQLEAALFCFEAIAHDLLDLSCHQAQFIRLLSALQTNSMSLTSNPVTLSQMCRVLRKFSQFFIAVDKISVAMELVMKALEQANQTAGPCLAAAEELQLSLVSEAVLTLKDFLCAKPLFFGDEQSLRRLHDVWILLSSPSQRVTATDRATFCVGICSVVVTLSNERQLLVYGDLISSSIDALERLLQKSQSDVKAVANHSEATLLADDIVTLMKLLRAYADASTCEPKADMSSGCDTSPDNHPPIPDTALGFMQRGWPVLLAVAERWSQDQQVAHALSEFVTELLPASSTVSQCRSLLEYLFNIVRSMQTPHIGNPRFEPLFSFLRRFVHSYGEGIDKTTCATLKGFVVAPLDLELCQAFETLLLSTLSKARTVFGDTWFQPSKARQPKDTGETPAALQDYNEALASFFAVLQECIETCPNFLLSLQIVSTKQNSYSLLHQSIEVAAASLYDSDPDVGRHAMRLLTAVLHSAHRNESVRSLLSTAPEVATNVVTQSLQGCCGPLERSNIVDAANLLQGLLTLAPEYASESSVLATLDKEHFQLGRPGILVVIEMLQRSARKQLNNGQLAHFLESLWDLHQIEDLEALSNSDAALHFIQQYS